MFSFFSRAPATSLSDEAIRWLFDATAWWTANFGGFAALASTPIVLPTDDYFTLDGTLEGEELAELIFASVLEHAQMLEWHVVLEAEDSFDIQRALGPLPHHVSSADIPPSDEEGVPIPEGEPLVVTYRAENLEDPVTLVAHMARSLSHYLLYEAAQPVPGTAEQRPCYVDLGAVLMGFGLFLANASFRFRQFTTGTMLGWQSSRSGTLSQAELGYALAIMVEATSADDRGLLRLLDANPRADVSAARKDIRERWQKQLDALRGVQASEGGPYRSVSSS